MKVIALVPARCGSRGFQNKNIAKIKTATLIELAVRVGLDCDIVDDVYISTDSKEYEDIALNAGADSLGLRPDKLATDTAKSVDVVIDFLNRLEKQYDYLVLLQPTAPMRNPEDISNMVYKLRDSNAQAIVSVEKIDEPHPDKLKKISEDGFIQSFLQNTTSEISRQLLSDVYKLNGAIYIVKCNTVLSEKTLLPDKTLPYVMPGSINIDSQFDFNIILGLLTTGKIEIYGV